MTSDKNLIRRRFEANFERYNALAHVQQRICAELAAAAAQHVAGPVARALEIGAGTGFLTGRLAALYPHAKWTLNDLTAAIRRYTDPCLEACGGGEYLFGDAEEMAFSGPYDLVASASTVQWFDDLSGFLHKTAAVTRSGGWLALSTFGPENFHEIRAATGEGLAYFAPDELRAMLEEAGYEVLWMRDGCETLWFATPLEVLYHIRATGVNSLRREQWTRQRLADFERNYRAAFGDSAGRVPLTYHPILVVAQKM